MDENERKEYYVTLRTILGATLMPTMTNEEIGSRITSCGHSLMALMNEPSGEPVEDRDEDNIYSSICHEGFSYDEIERTFISKVGVKKIKQIIEGGLKRDSLYTYNQLIKRIERMTKFCKYECEYIADYSLDNNWITKKLVKGLTKPRYTLNT